VTETAVASWAFARYTLRLKPGIETSKQMIPVQLADGYRHFRGTRFTDEEARYRALAEGQSPQTMVIACADSRVDPATIFSAAPGELFGGISASLDAADSPPQGQFIGPWVDLLSPVRDRVLADKTLAGAEDRQRALERMAVLFSRHNLRGFPFVADAIEAGGLTLHGAWFSIAEAELYWYGDETGIFEAVPA
jgi:carbonic anhydrase